MSSQGKSAYAAAGVDVEAGERAVALMRDSIAATHRPEVLGSLGGFAGLFDASILKAYQRPVLASATDGVGTKVVLAQRLDIHDTIGIDLVAMVVDDLVVSGAEPLFMTDYIACGQLVPERISAIVTGIARGCELAGCALVGGETAEHPGLLAPNEYDVAGAGTAVVEYDQILGPQRVRVDDVAVAFRSSGLHSNGYSLARKVFFDDLGWDIQRDVPEFGRTLGEEMLTPTAIYTKLCLAIARSPKIDVHAFSHITGGGIAANLARVLPTDLHLDVERDTWTPQAIFDVLATAGEIPRGDMEQTFNMGLGMVAIVQPDSVSATVAAASAAGVDAWPVGAVRQRGESDVSDAPAKGGSGGSVAVVGDYQ